MTATDGCLIPCSEQGIPGAPSMKMYSRDELMNGKNFGEDGEDGDDDEDEDEDDDGFPSKLVSIIRFAG